MKAIINGYLQEDLIKHELDLTDIEIIKYFQQFALSKNMKHLEKNNNLYFWLSYQKLIDDLPILNIKSKRTIARRFDILEQKGIFEKTIVNEGLKNFTYFRLTELHQSWIENISTQFGDFKKTKEKKVNKDSNVKTEWFDQFWSKYPKPLEKKQTREMFMRKVKDEDTFKLIMQDLEKRKGFEGWTKEDGKYIKYPMRYLRDENWSDKYETNASTSRYDVPIL